MLQTADRARERQTSRKGRLCLLIIAGLLEDAPTGAPAGQNSPLILIMSCYLVLTFGFDLFIVFSMIKVCAKCKCACYFMDSTMLVCRWCSGPNQDEAQYVLDNLFFDFRRILCEVTYVVRSDRSIAVDIGPRAE